MGKPVDEDVVDEKPPDGAAGAELEFDFHHQPPMYGSIVFVVVGALLAFVVSSIGALLEYPVCTK